MRNHLLIALLVTTGASAVPLVACSANSRAALQTDVRDATDAAAENVARNIATQQGEEQFKNAKVELATPLKCTASVVHGVKRVDIRCTGTTKTSGAALLVGTTDELPGASVIFLSGKFTGTVDGQPAFATARLGG